MSLTWQTGRLKTGCQLVLQENTEPYDTSFIPQNFQQTSPLGQSAIICSSHNPSLSSVLLIINPWAQGFGLISAVAKIIVACWVCWVTDRALIASDTLCRLCFFPYQPERWCLAAIIQHSSQVPLSHWVRCLLSACWKKNLLLIQRNLAATQTVPSGIQRSSVKRDHINKDVI